MNQTALDAGSASARSDAPQATGDLVRRRHGPVVWDVAADLADDLLTPRGLPLEEWRRAGRVQVVKTGPHRTVYRLQLESGCFYLKHYRVSDWKAMAQNIIRPCRALLEKRAAGQIAALGIPTFQTVAVGRRIVGGLVGESFLISREIADASVLDAFVAEPLGTMPEPSRTIVRQQLAVALGELAARLHHGRLIHRDFHAGNVLMRIGPDNAVSLWLIDLHAVSRVRRMTLGHIERNLAMFGHFFSRYATASDRIRFFRAYWRLAPKQTGSFAQIARRIDACCRTTSRKFIRRADYKWARGNRRLIIVDSDTVQCRGLACLGKEVLAAIRDNPERLFATTDAWRSPAHSDRSRTKTIDLTINGVRVAGTIQSVPVCNRRSRFGTMPTVRRGWELGHALLRRGIRTPRPLLFVAHNSPAASADCLLTETIPDAVTLDTWAAGPQQFQMIPRRRWTRQLADQMRLLHENGFDHPRLSPKSVLVSHPAEADGLWLLVDDAVRRRRMSRPRRVRRLAALNGQMQSRLPISHTDRLRFLKQYLRTGETNGWKQMWRNVADLSSERSGRFRPRRLLKAACLLAATLPVAGCRTPQQPAMLPSRYSVRSDQLLVLSDFRLPRNHPLIQDLNRLRDQVSATLNLPVQHDSVVIYMFGSEPEYRRYIAAAYPGLPRRRAYFVASRKELAVYTFWGDRVREDLRHEYTHGLLHASLQSVPLWLDEGLAEYFEVPASTPAPINSDDASRLRRAVVEGRRPDIERLEQIEDFSRLRRIDYQESWAWVSYMLHGSPQVREALLSYLHDLRDQPHPKALSDRLAEVEPDFETNVLAYVTALKSRESTSPPLSVSRRK